LFFSSVGPRCGTCHAIEGRGGEYGPDLTRYAASHDRRQALTSILEPSRDIAPRYVPWVLETVDGKTHVGLRLPLGGDGGTEPYIDDEGNRFDLSSEDVEFREPSKNSIMPAGLEKTMSIEDFADLLAFLLSTKSN
jgi:putative heme-binding domain-containing protein